MWRLTCWCLNKVGHKERIRLLRFLRNAIRATSRDVSIGSNIITRVAAAAAAVAAAVVFVAINRHRWSSSSNSGGGYEILAMKAHHSLQEAATLRASTRFKGTSGGWFHGGPNLRIILAQVHFHPTGIFSNQVRRAAPSQTFRKAKGHGSNFPCVFNIQQYFFISSAF